MRRTRLFWVFGATLVVLGGCSPGQDTKTPEQPRPAAVGTGGAGANLKSDGEFVHDVANKNIAAIELSRIALERATRPEIKSYAQLIVGGYAVAGDKLKSIVSGHALSWPAQLDDQDRKTAEQLGKKSGGDFEREYVAAMVDSHEDLAAKLESRLDVKSLADWKTAAAARTQSRMMPGPDGGMGDVEVRPNPSDNEITTKINQWAAETYPVAQKHLDTARALENPTKKPSNN